MIKELNFSEIKRDLLVYNDLILKALNTFDCTFNEFYKKIITKEYKACILKNDNDEIKAFFILKEVDNVLCIVALAGKDVKQWLLEIKDYILSLCHLNNINVIEIEGRRGWIRYLPYFGFEMINQSKDKKRILFRKIIK